MSRETALDVLLGTILLLVFAAGFGACVLLIGLSVHSADVVFKHFSPALPRSAWVLGLLVILSLVSGVRQLFRKDRRRSIFLSFAVVPAFLSIMFANSRSDLGIGGSYWMLALLPLLSMPGDSSPTRFRFFATASVICAIVAINAGLMGFGLLARIVTDCFLLGFAVSIALAVRQNWSTTKSSGPQAPRSPTCA